MLVIIEVDGKIVIFPAVSAAAPSAVQSQGSFFGRIRSSSGWARLLPTASSSKASECAIIEKSRSIKATRTPLKILCLKDSEDPGQSVTQNPSNSETPSVLCDWLQL